MNTNQAESFDKPCALYVPCDDTVDVMERIVPCLIKPLPGDRIAVVLEKSGGHYKNPVGFRFYGVRRFLKAINDKRHDTAIPLNQLLQVMFRGQLFGIFGANKAFAEHICMDFEFVVDFRE